MKLHFTVMLLFFADLTFAEVHRPKFLHQAQDGDQCPQLARPVIFIPGTMGSRLLDETSNRVAWGDFSRKAANGKNEEGRRSLALPMAIGTELHDLHDEVRPTGAVETLSIEVLPLLNLKANYYKRSLALLGSSTPVVSSTCEGFYVFAYDWRRSGDENAVLLSEFIARIKLDLAQNGKTSPKFDLIAHSGGTQIARYYLRYGGRYLPKDGRLPAPDPKAPEDFANLVFLGPPNAGTMTGLTATANGHRGHPVIPYYDRAVTGSMPGIYQLIPRARDHVLIDPGSGASLDPLDFDLWVERKWGLANPEIDKTLAILLPDVTAPAKRREIALDHLKKCLDQARRFQAALDVPAPKPECLRMLLVIGEGSKTPVTALAHPGKLREGEMRDGDGTVPSYSAWQLPYYEIRSGVRVPAGWDSVHRCCFNHDGVINEPDCVRAILRILGAPNGIPRSAEAVASAVSPGSGMQN